MKCLEQMDARDRHGGTPREKRVRRVPPEMGKFIAILAMGVAEGALSEIGAGCAALRLTLACRYLGRKLVAFEDTAIEIMEYRRG